MDCTAVHSAAVTSRFAPAIYVFAMRFRKWRGVELKYIRPFEDIAFFDTGAQGYRAQMLAYFESATFINSQVAVGGQAVDLHTHQSDQIYFVVNGHMTVQLGTQRHEAGPNSLVFIPAGLPHRNWNSGTEEEFHFEIIVPTVRPGQPLLSLSTSDAREQLSSEDDRGFVATIEELDTSMPGFGFKRLADQTAGSMHASIDFWEVHPGAVGTGMHIHDFDQFCYVLEGQLSVEIALNTFRVPARTLILLPAGVPHRQWNQEAVIERHLVVNVPPPDFGSSLDRGVELIHNGDDHVA
jgi:mannose-6-phosphate isomerase-like protein (cupin superfamily)